MHSHCLIVAVLLCISVASVRCGTEAELRQLLNDKLNATGYSPKVRPIKDTGIALRLEVDIYLVAINNVDEVEQKVTTTAYMKIKWTDSFMTWNASAYGGIDQFTLPQDDIWKPDIALSNAFDTVSGLGDKFMYLSITNAGVITWEPYQVFDSTCELDMTYFPFDTQVCDLQLVTWSSTRDMITIVTGSDGFSTVSYEPNANWELEKVSTYDSSTSSISGLSFSMTIRRKPIFYLMNFMIPIALLSVLNIFVFVLPCDSGEKTGYAIVLFLSFAIFLLIVTDIMPEGMNKIPVISTYLLIECVFSTIIVFLTILQLRLHNLGDDTPVTSYLQTLTRLINGLKRKVCCHGNSDEDQSESDNISLDEIPLKTSKSMTSRIVDSNNVTLTLMNSSRRPSAYNNRVSPEGYSRKVSPPSSAVGNNRVAPIGTYKKPISSSRVDLESNYDDGVENTYPKSIQGARIASARSNLESRMSIMKHPPPDQSFDDKAGTSENNADEDEVSWPKVALALDNLFFVLFFAVNALTTAVVFIVCAVH